MYLSEASTLALPSLVATLIVKNEAKGVSTPLTHLVRLRRSAVVSWSDQVVVRAGVVLSRILQVGVWVHGIVVGARIEIGVGCVGVAADCSAAARWPVLVVLAPCGLGLIPINI